MEDLVIIKSKWDYKRKDETNQISHFVLIWLGQPVGEEKKGEKKRKMRKKRKKKKEKEKKVCFHLEVMGILDC